jgi:hypothetical protein
LGGSMIDVFGSGERSKNFQGILNEVMVDGIGSIGRR